MFAKFSVLCVLISSVTAYQCDNLGEDEVMSLECRYNNDCINSTHIICTDPDYVILITVIRIDIDGQNGDFLLIKSGTEIDDGLTGRIFTHHINRERQYISLTNNVFVHFRVYGESSNNRTAFTLTAQRYAQRNHGREEEEEDNIIECPGRPEYYQYITVNMTIYSNDTATINQANNVFRETLIHMGQDYVDSPYNNITILCDEESDITDIDITNGEDSIIIDSNGNITADNIHLRRVIQCPLNWPHEDYCFQYTFALRVCPCENSWYYGTYQLNEEHLRDMWKDATDYFNGSIIRVSLPLHTESIPKFGIATIWVIIVLFVIFYLIAEHLYVKYTRHKMATKSKIAIMPSDDSRRESKMSLPPHPLQSVPPLFQNDMSFYDPDDSTSRFYQREVDDGEYDEVINTNLSFFAPKKNN